MFITAVQGFRQFMLKARIVVYLVGQLSTLFFDTVAPTISQISGLALPFEQLNEKYFQLAFKLTL